MLHAFRSRRAESMIETLISITVVVLSTMAALSMLRTALQGNQVIGEKLVAIQLATEALDAVKNVRDTNYLLLSSDPENCWNRLGVTDPNDCTDAPTISNSIYDGAVYAVIQNYGASAPLFKWSLSNASTTRGGELGLFRIDTTDEMDTSSDTAAVYADWSSSSYTGFTSLVSDMFTRTVTIDYDPVDSSGADLCPSDDCFSATATVEWTLGTLTQSVSLTRLFANVY